VRSGEGDHSTSSNLATAFLFVDGQMGTHSLGIRNSYQTQKERYKRTHDRFGKDAIDFRELE